MKILFDSQIFDSQKYGGISRYFAELFNNFNESDKIDYYLYIRNTNNEYLKNTYPFSLSVLSNDKIYPRFILNLNPLFKKIATIFFDFVDNHSNFNLSKKALKKQDFDIFHPTYYSTYFLKYLKNKKLIVTVYDMIHEIYPEYFLLDHGMTAKKKKKLILRADQIIAISESTKNDIIKFYGISQDKISVVYLGNSLKKSNNVDLDFGSIPDKYILFVGARNIYKNFIFFIESVATMLNKDQNLNIIVAGGYSGKNIFSEEEKNLFSKLNIKNQILYFSVDDNSLAYLYQNAICFVFPTLYEGFGIPVLEAFACDCPAIISNTSSLPEVGGDAVKYFDPTNSDSILRAVNGVVYNDTLRNDLILKGRDQLNKFSWKKTAEETIKIYLDNK